MWHTNSKRATAIDENWVQVGLKDTQTSFSYSTGQNINDCDRLKFRSPLTAISTSNILCNIMTDEM